MDGESPELNVLIYILENKALFCIFPHTEIWHKYGDISY